MHVISWHGRVEHDLQALTVGVCNHLALKMLLPQCSKLWQSNCISFCGSAHTPPLPVIAGENGDGWMGRVTDEQALKVSAA
jgi:hypothetical protein